jgi:hypothetical protein
LGLVRVILPACHPLIEKFLNVEKIDGLFFYKRLIFLSKKNEDYLG